MHLGWLLGDRFLMLTHIGRKSGQPRQVVLEVVRHDKPTHTYIIASGWGEQSDWVRNIQKTPEVIIHSGHQRSEAQAERLNPAEAARELHDYARRHPTAFHRLAGLMTGQPWRDDRPILNSWPMRCQSSPYVHAHERTNSVSKHLQSPRESWRLNEQRLSYPIQRVVN